MLYICIFFFFNIEEYIFSLQYKDATLVFHFPKLPKNSKIDTCRFSTLCSKLLDTGMPAVLVRTFIFMYQYHYGWVKWGQIGVGCIVNTHFPNLPRTKFFNFQILVYFAEIILFTEDLFICECFFVEENVNVYQIHPTLIRIFVHKQKIYSGITKN